MIVFIFQNMGVFLPREEKRWIEVDFLNNVRNLYTKILLHRSLIMCIIVLRTSYFKIYNYTQYLLQF